MSLYTGGVEHPAELSSLSIHNMNKAAEEYAAQTIAERRGTGAGIPDLSTLRRLFLVYFATHVLDFQQVDEMQRNMVTVAATATKTLDEANARLETQVDMAIGNDRSVSYILAQTQAQIVHSVATSVSTVADNMREKIAAMQKAAGMIKSIEHALDSLHVVWGGNIVNSREMGAYTHDLKTARDAYLEGSKRLSAIADRADKIYANAMRRDSAIRMLINLATGNGRPQGGEGMRNYNGIDPTDGTRPAVPPGFSPSPHEDAI